MANSLNYKESKTIIFNGEEKKFFVDIELGDPCKNGVCSFSITGKIHNEVYGCCHDLIMQHFPQFVQFIKLHNKNVHGQPLYPIENPMYFIKKREYDVAKDYLSCSDLELAKLIEVAKAKNNDYFAYTLYELGIVERWEQEAREGIKQLEILTNKKFVNPYTENKEKFILKKPNIDLAEFTPKKIEAKIATNRKELYNEAMNKIVSEYNDAINIAEKMKKVQLYVLNQFSEYWKNTLFVTHYNGSICVEIGWKEYEAQPTQEEITNFKKLDETKKFIADNIIFKFNGED